MTLLSHISEEKEKSIHCCFTYFNRDLCGVYVTSGGYLTLRLPLGFKLPLGAVNGPSLETFRNSSRSLRPWGETGLAAVATLKEFLNAISMGKLLADRC